MLFHTISLIVEGNDIFCTSLSAAVEKDDGNGVARAVQDLADKHFNYYSVFCNHQEQAMNDIRRLGTNANSVFTQV